MRSASERIADMLEAIDAIERHLPSDRGKLEEDELLASWFVRHLQILGEAARALPGDVRQLGSEIEWGRIIGMRNVLVHGYFDIDVDIVWEAVTRDVPRLKEQLLLLQREVEANEEPGDAV